MNNFYDAWTFLSEHNIFINHTGVPWFRSALDIVVVKVNPQTEEIDDKDNKNTVTRVWLECGPYDKKDKAFSHDIRLDCGSRTFEGAIVKLSRLVKKHYG